MLERIRSLLRSLPGLRRAAEDDPSPRRAVGRRGERAAARHLKRQGYRILERNYATRRGEVDIVAFRYGVLAFVEVRSQTEPVLIDPVVTVTRAKQLRVIKAAQAYCTRHGLPPRADIPALRRHRRPLRRGAPGGAAAHRGCVWDDGEEVLTTTLELALALGPGRSR